MTQLRRYSGFGFSLLGLALLLISGGCTIKKKGTAHTNQPPFVFFAPVPLENSLFTTPSQLFWYATDPDGYVVQFEYSIQVDSVVRASKKDNTGKPIGTPLDFIKAHSTNADTIGIWHWTIISNLGQNGQTAVVALPSDTSKVFQSVVFIRAQDDQGAYTPDSLLKWRTFQRKNRAPDTFLGRINSVTPPTPQNNIATVTEFFFSRDSLTYSGTPEDLRTGHTGVTITWLGSDSADYPRTQPKFEYFWELFGPFNDFSTAKVDSNKLWAASDRPFHYDPSFITQRYTSDQFFTFFGLRGADNPINNKPGYYFFRVRTRDDAGVSDPKPIALKFVIIHPRFDRKILLIRRLARQSWGPTGEPAQLADEASQGYYINLIRQAGYGSDFDSLQDTRTEVVTSPLFDSILARHKLVIVHKEQLFPTGNAAEMNLSLMKYMNVGGSVWVLGRDDLLDIDGPGASINSEGLLIQYDENNPSNGFPFFFFGINGMLSDGHLLRVIGSSGDHVSNEQFIGADTLVSVDSRQKVPGLPTLDIDTNVTKAYLRSPLRVRPDSLLYPDSLYRRMPAVNYFERGVRSQPLYLYRSAFPDTSDLNGKTVAVRSDRGSFKTACFGFSLYGIKEPQAAVLMGKMLEWFLGPP